MTEPDTYLEGLGHYDPLVREEAAGALGRFKEPRVIAALVSNLNDPNRDSDPAVAVERALVEIGRPAAEELLRALRGARA